MKPSETKCDPVTFGATGLCLAAGLAAGLFAACGPRWQAAGEPQAVVWLNNERFAAPALAFERGVSLNPFVRDERRRNIKTRVRFFERVSETARPVPGLAEFQFNGTLMSGPAAVFDGLLYVRRLPEEKTWIHELVFRRADGAERVLVRSGQRGATIRSVLPAPDRKKVLLVYNVNSELFLLIMLDHIPGEKDPAPEFEPIEVGGTPEIAWDRASSAVYARGSKQVLRWDGRGAPLPTESGPACFFPPTRAGLNISDEGREAKLSQAAGQDVWSLTRRAGWRKHADIATVKGPAIGRDCPAPVR